MDQLSARRTIAAPPSAVDIKKAIARIVTRVGRQDLRPAVRILTYHRIVAGDARDRAQMCTPLWLFERHLDHLLRTGRRVLTLAECVTLLRRGSIPPRAVVLTFDDGFEDTMTVAAPTLTRSGFPATVFVTAGLLAGDARAVENSWPGRYMTREQVAALCDDGRIEIACHGYTHVALRGLPRERLGEEIVLSKDVLERVVRRSVKAFAYPYGSFGSFDESARIAVQAAGYHAAVTGIFGASSPGDDLYSLRRCRVSWAEDPTSFERLLNGGYDWYREVQRLQAALRTRIRRPAAS